MDLIVTLHQDAPAKPAWGQPCNGCGLCCAVTTCPLGRIRFWRIKGPCPALTWDDGGQRYLCRLATNRWTRRWIAAGIGCDCSLPAG
ncbi:conserved hypothetical protein [Magnetospirillum sp. LM-5]|nr:conserved hypothetical protein [Magnetospirillum sp. LM-5]